MFQRWQRIILAALMVTIPLAAGAASEQHHHAVAASAARKHAKPGVKTTKPSAKAAKPSAKSASRSHHPGSAMIGHRPPTPAPSYSRSHFEIPQAKDLADTPEVVLNTRVRAALLAGLSARNAEEITPQTTNGVVTLTGSVKSRVLRARAEQVARKVHGVRAVKNELAVK